MIGIAAALAASLAWGASDYMGGIATRRVAVIVVLIGSQGFGLLLVSIVVAVRGEPAPPLSDLAFASLAGAVGAVGVAMLYRALAIGTMSVVAPLAATGVVVPVVVGIASGDPTPPLLLIGIVTVMAGVMLASREQDVAMEEAHSGHPNPTAHRQAIAMALAAALAFGIFFVALDRGSENDFLWSVLAQRTTSVTLLLIVALAIVRPKPGQWRLEWVIILALGFADAAANVLFAFSTTQGALSVAAVLSSLFPVWTVLLAHWLLHERLVTMQRVGVVLTLIGVAIVAALGS